ncbi:MAG: DUF29 domain-containing protein [Deltaproteobacteria bacterium]|nr:DUF29 domain-containing protein [Deltaproteobacteria bacterium]
MESKVKITNDFHGWLLDQASALRERQLSLLDWDDLAEELEAMAATERRELLRRLTTLFEHLLKLAYQPNELAKRGNGWRRTVVNSRIEIERLLGQSPGLKGHLPQFAIDAYLAGRQKAGVAMGLRRQQWEALLPGANPWSLERSLEPDFFPT